MSTTRPRLLGNGLSSTAAGFGVRQRPRPDAIVDLLPEGAAGGHVLITSRPYADWRAVNAQPLALDAWQRAESVAFLCERTGEQDGERLGCGRGGAE